MGHILADRPPDAARRHSGRVTSSGAMSSRIAQLALVDLLFIRVAQRRYDAAAQSLRVTYESIQDHRIDT